MKKVIALAVDVECTSFDIIGGDLLSIGLVEIFSDYTIGRSKCFYSKPRSTVYFSEKAQEIHGISLFKAMTFPEPRATCIDILVWLKPLMSLFPLEMINHANGKFDFKWLEQLMRNNGFESSFWKAFNEEMVVNTISLAKKNIVGLKNYKLNTIADYYQLELDHHEALSDAIVCAEIYCNIQKEIGTFTGRLL